MKWGFEEPAPHELDAEKLVWVERDCITTMRKGCRAVERHGKLPSVWDEIDSPRIQALLKAQKLEEAKW